ncbi:MAG: hypothetical protein IPP30_07645 [Flavobacterium sp.]|nr:hypothetical protein [Flavobacterium sp.]
MPYLLTIQPTDLQKMIKQLQLVEQQHDLFTIEGLLPSQFLVCAIQPNNEKESPKDRVKTILLHLAGDYHTHSAELSDKLNLKTHLLFKEAQYKLLFLKLNALLQQYQPEKKISIKEIKDCQSVADCVGLVERNM